VRVVRLSEPNAGEAGRSIRATASHPDDLSATVRGIVDAVRREGDEALIRFAEMYDGVRLAQGELLSGVEEAKAAFESTSPRLVSAMRRLRTRVGALERRLLRRLSLDLSLGGSQIKVRPVPLESVGCYAPGGLASYISTIVMMGVPGVVAGVGRLVLATPPRKNEADRRVILAAAYAAGFSEVLWSGGAQAIAALAYGTRSLRRVQKVIGPGNRYVVEAKRLVSVDVAIDFTAGPTELLVVLDDRSPLRLAALEMLAQAEHSPDTLVGALALNHQAEEGIIRCIEDAVRDLPEDSPARRALETRGFVATAENWSAAVTFINNLAPEHLLIYARLTRRQLSHIRSAGVVSYGPSASSVFLDYYAGPSHVIPTCGGAAVRGGLSVLDFVKLLSIVKPTRGELRRALREVKPLIVSEGLPYHLKALEVAAGIDT